MKIYLNKEPVIGPWGGGNHYVTKLCDKLNECNHDVVFKLVDNIDVLFIFDPRQNLYDEWYPHFLTYKKNNPKTKLIQRVGDVGAHGKPDLTRLVRYTTNTADYIDKFVTPGAMKSLVCHTTNFADHVIFPSAWAKDYISYDKKNFSVIYNKPSKEFYANRNVNSDIDKIKIVTHHWSNNEKKGFNIYKELDEYITQNKHTDITFTYIGRVPLGLTFQTANHHPPIELEKLVKELPKYNVYLTASLEETGANHVLEAMAAGLPIIYHTGGGSIPEYVSGYSDLQYSTFEELITVIEEIQKHYDIYKSKILMYNSTIDEVIDEYIKIINDVNDAQS